MTLRNTEISRIETPAPQAVELSALDHLKESFLAEGQRQINGLSQLVGKEVAPVAEPEEATTQSGKNAQLVGKAAADLIPLAVTAAAMRFGIGRYVVRNGEAANPLLKPSPLGVSIVESAASGFANSFLFTQSDAIATESTGSLLADRTKHGITGAASFSLLTGANIAAKGFGESVASGLARKIMTTPIGNGVLSGFPTGFVNAEMESVATDGHLTTDSTKIKQSIADMSLIGGVFSIGGVLLQRRSGNAVADTPATEARTDTPARAMRISDTFPSTVSEPTLFERQYIYRRNLDSELAAKPADEQWTLRSERLVDAVANRINGLQPKEFNFWDAANLYEPHDRPIVQGLLHSSAGIATDYALQKSLYSMTEGLASGQRNFALSASASGNMLAYLYRKVAHTGGLINYPDYAKNLARNTIIFADTDSLNESHLEQIKKELPRSPVLIADLNFDRLPNVVDFALGDQAVKTKLDKVLAATKQTMAEQPELTIEQAIAKTLNGGAEQIVEELNNGSTNKATIVRPQPMTVEEAFQPRVKPEDIRTYLEKHFTDPAQRIMAAEILADDVEFHTTASVIDRLQKLQDGIVASAEAKGLDPADDKYLVGLEYSGGSSEAYMTYLHARANNIPSTQITTLADYARNSGIRSDRAIIVEDAFYTGNQIRALISAVPSSSKVIAAISAHDKFARSMHSKESKTTELITTQTDFSHIDKHASSEDGAILMGVMKEPGYGQIANLKVFPHMTSDNTPKWLARFSYQLLKTPSPYYGASPWNPSKISKSHVALGSPDSNPGLGLFHGAFKMPDLYFSMHESFSDLYDSSYFLSKMKSQLSWSSKSSKQMDKLESNKLFAQITENMEKANEVPIKDLPKGASKLALITTQPDHKFPDLEVKPMLEWMGIDTKPLIVEPQSGAKFLSKHEQKTKHWLKEKSSTTSAGIEDEIVAAFKAKQWSKSFSSDLLWMVTQGKPAKPVLPDQLWEIAKPKPTKDPILEAISKAKAKSPYDTYLSKNYHVDSMVMAAMEDDPLWHENPWVAGGMPWMTEGKEQPASAKKAQPAKSIGNFH